MKAAISCFHGPQVEGSFSVMKQVMNTQTGRLDVSTYRAIQSIKYPLRMLERQQFSTLRKRTFYTAFQMHVLFRT